MQCKTTYNHTLRYQDKVYLTEPDTAEPDSERLLNIQQLESFLKKCKMSSRPPGLKSYKD